MPRARSSSKNNSTANLGFEAKQAVGSFNFGLSTSTFYRACRLAVMNLALRGIEADFGPEHADTFRRDLHPDLRADYVL
ncbi:MAG: SAM-dependent methyltransferase, partial [Verrucomicrobiota bacterium]|nr:SAM-dependent methyltransferase [Verrucomicrobiota bacterium]